MHINSNIDIILNTIQTWPGFDHTIHLLIKPKPFISYSSCPRSFCFVDNEFNRVKPSLLAEWSSCQGQFRPGPDQYSWTRWNIGSERILWHKPRWLARPEVSTKFFHRSWNSTAETEMRHRVTIHAKSFPTILGTSFAGTVQSVGSDVTTFQPKDIVAVNRSDKTLNYARYGIFQKCVVASTKTTAKVIPNASLPSAAATFINLATAYSALSFYMKLTKPPLSGAPSPENKDKQILIYGGSSSCGGWGIKYASDAGYAVIKTSSPAKLWLRCFPWGCWDDWPHLAS